MAHAICEKTSLHGQFIAHSQNIHWKAWSLFLLLESKLLWKLSFDDKSPTKLWRQSEKAFVKWFWGVPIQFRFVDTHVGFQSLSLFLLKGSLVNPLNIPLAQWNKKWFCWRKARGSFFYPNAPSPLIVFTQMTVQSATRLADTLTIYLSKLMYYF